MVDQPDNLVLVQLREIRSDLREIRAKLDEHDKRFDVQDERADEMRNYVRHALGLGAMHDIKLRELDPRLVDSAARQKRTEEMIAARDRRIKKVEDRVE